MLMSPTIVSAYFVYIHIYMYANMSLHMYTYTGGIPLITAGGSEESLTMAESGSLEGGGGGVASSAVDPIPYSEDPLQPPSWKLHANFDKDVLEDVSLFLNSNPSPRKNSTMKTPLATPNYCM